MLIQKNVQNTGLGVATHQINELYIYIEAYENVIFKYIYLQFWINSTYVLPSLLFVYSLKFT